MRVVRDDLWLCDDCLLVSQTGDYGTLDFYYGHGESPGRGELRDGARERAAQIDAGLDKLGPNLVPSFDSETGKGIEEFSTRHCDACGTHLAGGRHEFAVLGI